MGLPTIYQKWWDPFSDRVYAETFVHRVALFIINGAQEINFLVCT